MREATTIAETHPPQDVVVVVNRGARRGANELDPLHASLRAHGISVAAFHTATGHVEVCRHVRQAMKAGVGTVIVGGGDGTMAKVVDVLAHSETVLGVLPLGTGNSFAQTLGITLGDVDAAVRVIAAGKVEKVDLGVVNGTHFANFATIGLSSEIAGAASAPVKGLLGPIAYGVAAIRPFFLHPPFRATISWRGGKMRLRTRDIIIANGRYFGFTPVTPDATITDGKLNLFTTDDPTRFGSLRTYLAFGRDAQTRLPDAHVVTATSFTIRTHARQRIGIDGELIERTPAKFRVAQRALRVYVP